MASEPQTTVGIDPNMYFTALCKIKGKEIIKWGLVDWTPDNFGLMYDRLSEYIDDQVDQTWVEQQMNRPMEFRSGVSTKPSTGVDYAFLLIALACLRIATHPFLIPRVGF